MLLVPRWLRTRVTAVSIAIALGAAGVYAIGALSESEESRVLELADDIPCTLSPEIVRDRLRRWVDLNRAPLEISAPGLSAVFRGGEETAMFERIDRELRRSRSPGRAGPGRAGAYGQQVRLLARQVEVTGDRARLTTRLLHPSLGTFHGTWDLELHDRDWLVVRVALTR